MTLMFSAEKCQQDGDLREALRRYVCALELIVNQQSDEGARRYSWLWDDYPSVMRRLQRWAAEPGQSPDLIRQAIREVAKPLNWIDGDERDIERRYRPQPSQSEWRYGGVCGILPVDESQTRRPAG